MDLPWIALNSRLSERGLSLVPAISASTRATAAEHLCRQLVDFAQVFVLLSLTTGCDDGMIRVTGTITMDGEPLEAATVTFMRADGKGRPAAGLTDEIGVFELTSFRVNDGLPAGDYLVTITKIVDGKDFRTSSSSIEAKHRDAYKKAKSFSPQYPELKKVLPAIYGNPRATPFSCTIPPTGELAFEIDSSGAG